MISKKHRVSTMRFNQDQPSSSSLKFHNLISSDDEKIEIFSDGEEERGQSELLDQRYCEGANVTRYRYRYPRWPSSLVFGSSNRGLKVEEDVGKMFKESMSVHNGVEEERGQSDSSVEKIEILSDGEEERGQSELLDQRYCEDANVTSYRYPASSSSSVVSGSSNRGLKVEEYVGKMFESMSVHNGVEDLGLLPHQKLLKSAEKPNFRLNEFPFDINLNVEIPHQKLLKSAEKPNSRLNEFPFDINLNVEKSLDKILSDEKVEKGKSELFDQRYCKDANITSSRFPASSSSVISGSSNRGLKVEDLGKMSDSMSVHNGVEDLGLLPHQKLLKSAEKRNSRLNELTFDINLNVEKLLSLAKILSDEEEERGQSKLLDQRYCEGANVTSYRYPASSSLVMSGSSNRGLKVEDVGKMSDSMSVHNGAEEERGQSDSSVEKIEILSDGEEERGQSSSVVSGSSNSGLNVEDVGKMFESMSVHNGVEDLGLLPHQKLVKSAEKPNSRWNEFVDINLNVEISLASKPAKKSKKEIFREPFYVLTEEEDADVSAAFSSSNRRETLVKHQASNIEITGEILQCLRPGGWLNDEVINLYLELLKEREEREPNNFLKCHFFNTFFYRKLISGSHGYDFEAIRKWNTPRKIGYGLIECDKIFVPIHKPLHWCLAVINRKDKKFQYLDSLKGMDAQVLEVLARYYVDEVKDKGAQDIDVSSWEYEFVHDLPKQENGFDHGMFLLKYTDFYSRRLRVSFGQKHMPYFRRRTAKEILKLKAE